MPKRSNAPSYGTVLELDGVHYRHILISSSLGTPLSGKGGRLPVLRQGWVRLTVLYDPATTGQWSIRVPWTHDPLVDAVVQAQWEAGMGRIIR